MAEHICGWATPSGIVMKPSDCAACQDEKQERENVRPEEGQ